MEGRSLAVAAMRMTCCLALTMVTASQGTQVGAYVSHTTSGNVVTLSTGGTQKVRVTVCTPTIIKVEFDPRGTLTDNVDMLNADFMTKSWSPVPQIQVTDGATSLDIATGKLTVQIQKSPLRFRYIETATGAVLTGEDATRGMAAGSGENPWLQLTQRTDEHYFGWGEAYAWFMGGTSACDKKGRTGGRGCEAPFMYSTGGYGVFAVFPAIDPNASVYGNDRGPRYDLTGSLAKYSPPDNLSPNMLCYYFIAGPGGSASANNWREVIDGYTQVSGRPQLIGKKYYGIHRDIYLFGGVTVADFRSIADRWRAGRFPMDVVRTDQFFDWGTMGYATANADLLSAVAYYKAKGYALGGMMIGFGFDGCCGSASAVVQDSAHAKAAVDHGFDYAWYDAMTYQNRSKAKRAFDQWKYAHGGDESKVWTAKGWWVLSSQSFAATHTGDGLGEDRAWAVVPAHLEQSLTGYSVSYTDLGENSDWNYIGTALRPVASYHQSGGAGGGGGNFKVYDYPSGMQDLIRKWSRLHYRFIPYLFTYGMIAHETGMPVWRHMVCHDPKNSAMYNKDRQAFVGDQLLVSPYYPDGDNSSGTRSGILLPTGSTWYDYFDGTSYTGGSTVNCRVDPGTGILNFKLPMFVKAGAIIPLMDTLQYIGEKPETDITLQIWPSGASSFTLYEDETPVKTAIACNQSASQTDVVVGPFPGSKYCPDASKRSYTIELHTAAAFQSVMSGGVALPAVASRAALAAATSGWFRDPSAGGITFAKANGNAASGFSVSFCQSGQCSPVSVAESVPADRGRTVHSVNRGRCIDIPLTGAYRVEMFDTRGMVVSSFSGNGPKRIDTARLSTGVVFVKVTSAAGRIVTHIMPGR